jgi:hypothetical protein
MTLDEFWEIVERGHEAAHLEMAAKCRLRRNELCILPVEEVLSWQTGGEPNIHVSRRESRSMKRKWGRDFPGGSRSTSNCFARWFVPFLPIQPD